MIWGGYFRGLSDSKWTGVEGAFYKCVGLDGNSTPGILKVHQKLTKSSSTTIDAFVKVKVAVSTGESFWFSSTSGKIWRLAADNTTWLLVHTTTPAAGGAGCLGASEYNGYLYWATESRLHRIAMADAHATLANWTANAAEDWATFTVTDDTYHPMCIQDNRLFIGDKYYVASVNAAGTFAANKLDIKTPLRIVCMAPYDIDVAIGTRVASNVNKAEILRWDTVSNSYNTSDPIEEVGVNAFIRDDNYLYAQCGTKGNIYFYDGERLEIYKRIPGDWTGTNAAIVHPNAASYFEGRPIFGLSNSSGNPTEQGVYALGGYSRDYPKVLDLSWVISQDKTASIEIGAVGVIGNTLMVAWKDGTTYGVDAVDYTAKYASAYFETTMLFQGDRGQGKTLKLVEAMLASIPSGTSLTFSYSVNGAAYVAMTSVTDTTINRIFAQLSVPDVGSLQIKVAFTVSVNNAPELETLHVEVE